MHFIPCNVFYAMYSMLLQFIVLNAFCIEFYALHSWHCILCVVFYELYNMHCIPCNVFYAMYSMHCILCILLYAFCSMHCILCIVRYALCSMYCILCIVTLKLITGRPTDQQTDRPTDIVSYRAAIAAKNLHLH
jgi:hypothetical protein